ncbi:MAG: TIGR00282 family metallophosphoesterase [Candidatus Kapabacteria bacterium]|nr:TIGR00282 family metallophosphoesterase [Ignavibacteriota bacterium]MCW5883799.1 TIGR00282 family metallophosphoesterase [Candidatus Kapabacteria bacterium]
MKLLFIGDIVGRNALNYLCENIEELIKKHSANLVVVNGENTDEGKGLTEEQSDMLFSRGVDIITTGNHIWDNWKSRPLLIKSDRVLRPMNYPPGNPGRSFKILEVAGFQVAVLQLQGRTYMQTIDCPFRAADNALKILSEKANVIIVDFHAEATAEKISMGWHLDGKVSVVIGTHTHIQTADACIMPEGTAYISDVGMTGPYDSVLGMRKDIALKRLQLQTAHKYEMADGDMKIAGVVSEIDAETGQAISIESFMYPSFIKSVYEQL